MKWLLYSAIFISNFIYLQCHPYTKLVFGILYFATLKSMRSMLKDSKHCTVVPLQHSPTTTIWLSNGGYLGILVLLKSNQNDGAKNRLMMCHHEQCSNRGAKLAHKRLPQLSQIMQHTVVFFCSTKFTVFSAISEMESIPKCLLLANQSGPEGNHKKRSSQKCSCCQ